MSCHESLMARRRKRSKANRLASNGGPVVLDKSLPALPPNAATNPVFSPTPETETPPSEYYGETPTETSPRPRNPRRKDGSRGSRDKGDSSETDEARKGIVFSADTAECRATGANVVTAENLTLPASTYTAKRHSYNPSQFNEQNAMGGGDDDFFIPMALDPNTAPGPSPMSKGGAVTEPTKQSAEADKRQKDYFNRNGARVPSSSSSHRDALRENGRDSSRSSSADRTKRDGSSQRMPPSPHIAYQQKGRKPSAEQMEAKPRKEMSVEVSPAMNERGVLSASSSNYGSQATSPAEFKLQDAPKTRKGSVSRKLSKTNPNLKNASGSGPALEMRSPESEAPRETSPTSLEPSPLPRMDSQQHVERPARGDSLERPTRGDSLGHSAHRQPLAGKEVGSGSTGLSTPTMPSQPSHERNTSTSSVPRASHDGQGGHPQLNGRSISKPNESPISKSILDVPTLPIRSASRPSPLPSGGDYTSPRPPPIPPAAERHKTSESMNSIQSNMSAHMSPTLPRYSGGENFSMEEEMGRILKGEQIDEREQNVLRRVSNAAKHMRSFSDRGGTTPKTHRFVRSPSVTNGSIDISSPISASPGIREDNTMLRNEVMRYRQKIVELETYAHTLEETVNGNQDMSAVNNELKQKRNTMAFLDTQRELVVRELEVMTDHLKKVKETGEPLDVSGLKSSILRDFKDNLEKMKAELGGEIEDLIRQRNKLTTEITDIIQMKDKGMQEYEDLSAQNQQLIQTHNELVHKIQDMYKSNKGVARQPLGLSGQPPPLTAPLTATSTTSSTITSPNGLGIYTQHSKEPSTTSMDPSRTNSNDPSMSNLINEDAEPAIVQAPHLVNIRKGRPNMWKSGKQAVAKNIKGIKGAFASANQYPDRSGGYGGSQTQVITEGIPYGSTNPGNYPVISGPMDVKKGDGMPPFWASQKSLDRKGPMKGAALGMGMPNGSGTNIAGDNGKSSQILLEASETYMPLALFGTDLSARCQFEKREIPFIVMRCIEEVEVRGIDVEGVYRKSGGSGQVNSIKGGFEKDPNYDIGDPDLDIHAVTSCLKQYFRRLPVPLITFDVYDPLLEAAQIQDSEKKFNMMRNCMELLPKAHKDVLSFLVFHLARVMAHEQDNLVSHYDSTSETQYANIYFR